MDSSSIVIIEAIIIAIVTGVLSGVLSAMGTINSMKVHIDYIREAIDKHDKRLEQVEAEQHRIAGAVGVNGPPPQTVNL